MVTYVQLQALFIICFTLSIFCDAAAVAPRMSDIHNIDQCDPTKATTPLLRTNVFEPAKFWSVTKRVLRYPEATVSATAITCVKVTNLDTTDTGGYPQIVSGGVGSYDVQILLTSQWNQALNFRVEVWTG